MPFEQAMAMSEFNWHQLLAFYGSVNLYFEVTSVSKQYVIATIFICHRSDVLSDFLIHCAVVVCFLCPTENV